MSELRSNGTDLGGPGYVHPRSDRYADKFDDIFRKGACEEEECGECDCK
jgi:hypothetical protein